MPGRERQTRVLILMPTVRDAERTAELLAEAGVVGFACTDLAHLCQQLRVGGSAVLLTDEVLLGDTTGQLAEAARAQQAWSAIPFVVLARESAGVQTLARMATDVLLNAIVVERPVRTRTLLSVVLSAIRGRKHQYEVRDAIDARERQAAELMAQDERLRFALSAGKLGAWELDLRDYHLACSEICKANFGRPASEPFSYDDLQACVYADDRPRVLAEVEHSVTTGADYDSEYRILWPDDVVHWVMMRGRVAFTDDGEPMRMAGVSLDISDHKRVLAALHQSQVELARQADQLRAADARKDEFLATLAHELRNPLAPIRTGLDLLNVTVGSGTDPTLSVMRRQLDHMVRLIDDLLDASRITQGKLELKVERALLSDVIATAIEASLPLIDHGKHSLATHFADDVWIDADATRVAQIVSNLLNNAAKYTAPCGNIDLSTRREGPCVVIEVRDNGIGIPKERIEDVFNMFSQVDRALDRAHGGLGIGLALVRRIAEMHGGKATATSAGPGTGSTFTVTLPCVVEELSAQSVVLSPASASSVVASSVAALSESAAPSTSWSVGPQQAGTAPSHDDGPEIDAKRILIVDDNQDAADLLSRILSVAGHDTCTANDGPQAILEAEAALPHAIILDIGMPGMNGYDVARALRRDPRFRDTLLIALTGWGTQDDKLKAHNAGFDFHLTKPVNASDVRRIVSSLSRPAAQCSVDYQAVPVR